MLTSLFGDLQPRRGPLRSDRDSPTGFANTAVFEDAAQGFAATQVMDELRPARVRPQPVVEDVFVSGSPAAAMRAHFAGTRSDLERASSMITLLDPSRLWAPAVVKTLSDASGQPVEKLHVREQGTLRTLAVVERTMLPRRQNGPLKVYHADIRASGAEHDEIATVLAEHSHMTTVIVGALQPHAVEMLLRALLAATQGPNWHCPWLMFLLPPGSDLLRERILSQPWPAQVHTAAVAVSLTGTSTVWNTVLAAWDAAQQDPQPQQAAPERAPQDSASLGRALAGLARTEGVLACGVVDLDRGELLASDSRQDDEPGLARAARALVAARAAHIQAVGNAEALPEELLVTVPGRIQLLRCVGQGPRPMALALVLDRQNANLALVRFKLAEAERQLG